MIEVDGKMTPFRKLRENSYNAITDEMLFVASASNGAISVDWLMDQPIRTRARYFDEFKKMEEDRERNSKK